MSRHQHAYYPGLNSLRGLAILLVVLDHNFHFLALFRFGWMGVDLFFVLSGFLITDILLAARSRPNYFRNFYARRILRIFPLYYASLAVFFLAGRYLFSPENQPDYDYYVQHQGWFWSYLQNWLFIRDGFPRNAYLTHFWSLAVEEQFYLVWPFVVYLLSAQKLERLILSLLLFALCLRLILWVGASPSLAVYHCNPFTRMDSLLAGCLACLLKQRSCRVPLKHSYILLVGCVVMLVACFLVGKDIKPTNPYIATVGYSIIAIGFALFLLFCIANPSPFYLRWFIHAQPLHFLGKISFALYVFHLPLYLAASSVLLPVFQQNANWSLLGSKIAVSIVATLLTIIAAVFSYHWLETPFLQWKKKFRS